MPSTTTETIAATQPGWANRLVAKWCDRRAHDSETRKLLTRCRHAYKNGPLVGPVRLFADVLESQILANEAEWRKMEKLFREAADREVSQAVGKIGEGGFGNLG